MKFQIIGDDFQILNVWLENGESIFSEAGAMIYMSGNINMEAKFIGGIGGVLKRALVKESAALVSYESNGLGFVAFSKKLGKIMHVKLNKGESLIVQKDGFLASTPYVDINIKFVKKIGAGLFGGEGFILQEIKANEDNQIVFLEATGQVIRMDIKEGQVIKVDAGNLVAFDNTIDYDIERVGNIKTMLFAKEGLFLVRLSGNGRIWLQSTNFSELLSSYASKK